MIIQKGLTIHNGCQHKDVHVEFSAGRTYAVTGKNACGKTNFLQLNMYGLLGIVNKSWGSQKDFNRTGTKDGYVEVHLFDTGSGRDIYVRRHFTAGTKNPDRLWYMNTDHDPDIMGRDAIDAVLEGLYGVPIRILFELLYMRQGMTNWLLTASSTSIYTFMNSIFDTSKFKKIREVLMDAANSIALYEVDVSRIEYLKSVISQLESKTYEDVSTYEEQLKSLRESLSNIASNCISKSEKMHKMSVLMDSLSKQRSKVSEIQESIDSVGTDPAPWLTDEHYKFINAFGDIERDLVARKAALEGKHVVASQMENVLMTLHKSLESLRYDIGTLEGELVVYTSGHSCAFCGADIHDHSKYHDAVSDAIIGKRKDRLESQCKKLESDIKSEGGGYKTLLDDIDKLKDQISEIDNYVSSSEATRTTITDAIAKRQKWESAKAAIGMAIEALHSAQVMQKHLEDEIDKLNNTPVMEDDVDQTRRALQAQISEKERLISAVNSQKITDATMLNSCRSELSTRLDAQAKNEVSQNMFNRIMRIREGASNKRIPARYLADKVDMLNGELEAYCRMAGMPVILFLDRDDFMFRFTDGSDVRPAGQLSGAQQTLCSTILQLALVRVVGPRLGVIQMDEPTVFLDPANRSKLLTLFESLSSVLSATGTITIVPTHDTDLITACNDRIEL